MAHPPQTTEDIIAGFEAAKASMAGSSPDNMKAIIEDADALEPRLNHALVEYAQARSFLVDAAGVGQPQDEPRVERAVAFVRQSSSPRRTSSTSPTPSAGRGLVQGQGGMRTQRTTPPAPPRCSPPRRLPGCARHPSRFYDVPLYARTKVHRDHHIEVARSLYSVPGNFVGTQVDVRADPALVRISARGHLVKVHPRQAPGRRITDASDLPAERSAYATCGTSTPPCPRRPGIGRP